jgi:hypothetical protein
VANDRERSRIETALVALSRALSELGAPWMVIGGIAVIAHGVQRMTTDIDAVIQGDAVSIHALIDVLRRHHIIARVPNAETFAATNLVVLTRHEPTEVDLDLSLGWTAFEHEALASCANKRFGRVAVPMAGVEDLLVFKVIAARPRDIDDAITLLTLYPNTDMTRVRARVRVLAEAAEAPELLDGLEHVIRATSHPTTTRALASTDRSAEAKPGTPAKPPKGKRARKIPKTPRSSRRSSAKR